MSDTSKIKEFPDINNKLTAPTKKSLFERQKAEAEAKRLREEAETAAVYEDFVKSFDDGDAGSQSQGVRARPGGSDSLGLPKGGPEGPPKRHFSGAPSGPSGRPSQSSRGGFSLSGPGSFGPAPGSASRKRGPDGSQREGKGLLAFEDAPTGPADTKAAFKALAEEEDHPQDDRKVDCTASKPTLLLASLPPGTSPAVIKSLIPPLLKVDAVRILPPSGPASVERRSVSSHVILAQDTPSGDIDTAVNTLQNRYLGRGYYLSLSRHLTSASLHSASTPSTSIASAASSLPFGARQIKPAQGGHLNRGPPSSARHRGGYAPPSSFAPGPLNRGPGPAQVHASPPADLRHLKLIHKTLELLLTHGPEFEALLMSRPDVQRDEKWAWIWNPRSPGGVWYRWRLWDILSNGRGSAQRKTRAAQLLPQEIFDGGAAWKPPEQGLRFEYITQLDEFVSDSEYNSSEDDDSEDEGQRRHASQGVHPSLDPMSNGVDAEGRGYLNPLQKSKLTHLLARLPMSNARLRKGDVARITAFAIEHAGEGAEEVVDMIVANVDQPFAFSAANPAWKAEHAMLRAKAEDGTAEDKDQMKDKEDSSPSKLIALYIISDILSSSSTSGVRHAWRYRQLFETALKRQKTFEALGRLDKEMHWGRLKAEKWKRSVGNVLTLWEGWCVFPQAAQEHFASVFANPPPTAAEQAATAAVAASSDATSAAKSRWKTVDVTAQATDSPRPAILNASPAVEDDVDGEEMDLDGEPMLDDEDLDGEPMDDVDGDSMQDGEQGESATEKGGEMKEIGDPAVRTLSTADPDAGPEGPAVIQEMETSKGQAAASEPARRRRPKAEDMFADSDED